MVALTGTGKAIDVGAPTPGAHRGPEVVEGRIATDDRRTAGSVFGAHPAVVGEQIDHRLTDDPPPWPAVVHASRIALTRTSVSAGA